MPLYRFVFIASFLASNTAAVLGTRALHKSHAENLRAKKGEEQNAILLQSFGYMPVLPELFWGSFANVLIISITDFLGSC